MNASRLTAMIFVLSSSFFFAACGPGHSVPPTATAASTDTLLPPTATAAPSLTPTIAPTPTLAVSQPPKLGHWEGSGENEEVSFEIKSDGHIHNLKLTYKIVGCVTTIQQITVQADGTFTYSEHKSSSGKDLEVNRISGAFPTSTAMTAVTGGSAVFCEMSQLPMLFGDVQSEVSISATWKNP